jgi:Ran GTPase-activating protein (RanGAP) involved in mRNA processing and transport
VASAGAPQGDGTELDLTGSREFLTQETAEELLAPMLEPGSKIQKIKFSTKSFGVEAAEVAARAIRNISSTLIDADMSDIIAGRPEDEALAALRIISDALSAAHLLHLNLSDNALGEKGIRAFAASFQHQKALESIAIQNVGCSVHGCAAVDELMQCTGSLKRLHLLNNMSGDEGAASIANVLSRCPAMEDFKMASSRVGGAGGIALAKALAVGGTNLLSLDIHDNPMTSEIAEELASLLGKHSKLKKLNLNDTCLGDDGVETVASALANGAAPVLEELEMELNEITVTGAEPLAAALAVKTGLKKVNLKENELEDDGALAIARGVTGLASLQILDLCTNQIKRGGACAVAKAVSNKMALHLLALDDNEISEAGIEALKSILKKAGKLEALGSLEENCPDDDDDEEEGEGDEIESEDDDVDALTAEFQKEHL